MPQISDKKNLQTIFLNQLRKNKSQVTVFLHNGVKLQGVITWFDSFCLLLRSHTSQQLVYKHSVATVMPRVPLDLRAELVGEDSGLENLSSDYSYEEQDDWP